MEGTSLKIASCVYTDGSNCGDNRRKSNPNFKLCEFLCTDRPSTTLICRCRFRTTRPTCNSPPIANELTNKLSTAFSAVNGLGSGKDDSGTAPPKLSTRAEPSAFVRL